MVGHPPTSPTTPLDATAGETSNDPDRTPLTRERGKGGAGREGVDSGRWYPDNTCVESLPATGPVILEGSLPCFL